MQSFGAMRSYARLCAWLCQPPFQYSVAVPPSALVVPKGVEPPAPAASKQVVEASLLASPSAGSEVQGKAPEAVNDPAMSPQACHASAPAPLVKAADFIVEDGKEDEEKLDISAQKAEKLKAQALRPVVQDDCPLAEVLQVVHRSVWPRWENQAGKDLLTLSQGSLWLEQTPVQSVSPPSTRCIGSREWRTPSTGSKEKDPEEAVSPAVVEDDKVFTSTPAQEMVEVDKDRFAAFLFDIFGCCFEDDGYDMTLETFMNLDWVREAGVSAQRLSLWWAVVGQGRAELSPPWLFRLWERLELERERRKPVLDHSRGRWFGPGEPLPPGYVITAHPEGHTAPQEGHSMSDMARESFVIPASCAAAAVKAGSKPLKSMKKKTSGCC